MYWSAPQIIRLQADVVEEEETGPESGLAHLGVPHEETPREAARAACAAARKLDAVLLVDEEHEHVTIARKQCRVVLGGRHALAKFAGHAPLAVDPIAKPIDEQVDYVGVPDATIVWAIDGTQLGDVAILGKKDTDISTPRVKRRW